VNPGDRARELIDLMPAEGFDVSLTGFEAPEIDLLLADMAPSKSEPEDILPALPRNPTTRRGDLWRLGNHRLLCGDAREAADFARLMEGASASAVFCDPPYNLRVSEIGGRGRVRHPEFAFASGDMVPAQFRKFLLATLANGVRVSAEGAVHYVCMDWRHIGDLIDVGRKLYGDMLNLVVWNKSSSGLAAIHTKTMSNWAVSAAIAPTFGPTRASTPSGEVAWRRSPPIPL
jgi:hypothetical protein